MKPVSRLDIDTQIIYESILGITKGNFIFPHSHRQVSKTNIRNVLIDLGLESVIEQILQHPESRRYCRQVCERYIENNNFSSVRRKLKESKLPYDEYSSVREIL